MERILIARLGAMGDILHALPAVTALRKENPRAHIGWLVERHWQELLSSPLVDTVHLADTKHWRKHPVSGVSALSGLRRELHQARYEVCCDLQGAMKSALLARMGGAKIVIGSDTPREGFARLLYQQRVRTTRAHVIEQAAEVCGVAVASRDDSAASLPIDPAAEEWCASELRRRGITRFALLNPGAGWGAKQWPAERYGGVARRLQEFGIASLINAGPNEAEPARKASDASQGTAVVIDCSLSQLISFTRRAALFIGGDTGPMHLANLLGVPVIAIFGPTDPLRNGPYYTPSIVLRSAASSTSYTHTSQADEGLLNISIDEVADAARRLL